MLFLTSSILAGIFCQCVVARFCLFFFSQRNFRPRKKFDISLLNKGRGRGTSLGEQKVSLKRLQKFSDKSKIESKVNFSKHFFF